MNFIKLFYQILRKHKFDFIIPIVLVVFFAYASVKYGSTSDHKANIYFVDNDNTVLTQNLKKNLEQSANILDASKTNDIDDDLITTYIDCYIEIPSGFTDSFINKENCNLNLKYIPNSSDGTLISNKVNTILNNYHLYLANSTNTEQFYNYLNSSSSIISVNEHTLSDVKENTIYAYLYPAYGIVYALPAIVGTFFIIIRKKNLKDRYIISPVTNKKYLWQITLANISADILFIIIIALLLFVGMAKSAFNITLLLNILNCFVLSILGINIGLLLGFFAKSRKVSDAFITGISLALAFLGGVFIPLRLFSDSMVKVSQCTPCYWYVKACNAINLSSTLDYSDIFKSMGIELLFGIALFCVLLVVNKKTNFNNN